MYNVTLGADVSHVKLLLIAELWLAIQNHTMVWKYERESFCTLRKSGTLWNIHYLQGHHFWLCYTDVLILYGCNDLWRKSSRL